MRTIAAMIDMVVAFINVIILKIKDRWNDVDHDQAIDKVE